VKVAFIDIDGTLIKGQTQIHFLFYLFWGKEVSTKDIIKVFAWYFSYKLLGKKINEKLASDLYKKLIGGKTKNEVGSLVDGYFERIKKYMFPEAGSFVSKLKKEGFEIYLLTSTLCPISKKFEDYFSIQGSFCTDLVTENDKFTGDILGKINQGEIKRKRILDFIDKNNPKEIIVATDHITDLGVLDLATRPIVVNPDLRLLNFAKKNKWEIINL